MAQKHSYHLTTDHEAYFGLPDAAVLSPQPHSDPVARHAQWVSSPALGILLPQLQRGARDLLSDLVAARARAPATPATVAAAESSPLAASSPAARSSSGDSTRIAATSDRGCTCALTVAEQWSRDEARRGEGRAGETRSRTRSFEPQSRREQEQCATCGGVPTYADCSTGVGCGGSGETGGAGAAGAAAVGVGVEHGVVEKAVASLEKECETLRIVVQALREKEDESQASAVVV